MTIAIGDTLPQADFIEMGPDGPAEVPSREIFEGRRIALFAVPGAFTGVCSTQHMPSFVRVADDLRAKGIDEIVCVAVNDPFVLDAWGKSTGGSDAGIRIVGDLTSTFTKAIGMDFSNPGRGFIDRSKRYSMLVENGVVKALNVEESPGSCEISAGNTLLDAL